MQTPKLHRPPLPETNGMILARYLPRGKGKGIFLQSEPLRPASSQGQQAFKPGLLAFSLARTHKLPMASCKARAQGAPQHGTGDTGSGAT